jgi:hypothetical protein
MLPRNTAMAVTTEGPHVVVPNKILGQYQRVTLCDDSMFVNKNPLFVTISRNIKFGTVEMIMNRQQKTILGAVTQVCQLYGTKGFQVDNILMDGEFECLREELAAMGVGLNTIISMYCENTHLVSSCHRCKDSNTDAK